MNGKERTLCSAFLFFVLDTAPMPPAHQDVFFHNRTHSLANCNMNPSLLEHTDTDSTSLLPSHALLPRPDTYATTFALPTGDRSYNEQFFVGLRWICT